MNVLEIYCKRTTIGKTLVKIDEMIRRQLASLAALEAPTSAAQMLQLEQRTQAQGTRLSDLRMIKLVLERHQDTSFCRQVAVEAREAYRQCGDHRWIKNRGWQQVCVRFRGGTTLRLESPYLRPSCKGQRGRPRIKRGTAGVGCYPVLEKLGLIDGVSPCARSMISRQVVLCASYEEARGELERDHLPVDISTLVRVATSTGKAALEHREAALQAARRAPLPDDAVLAGQRVRVSVDGGRARTRRTLRRRGRRKKNGRRDFELSWVEPRLITVDVIDDRGERDRTQRPIYEVVMGDADAVFSVLTGLLRLLGAHLAAEVVFVADGARWIWERVDSLLHAVGLARDRVHLVLDYYHAAEQVGEAVDSCRNLSEQEREHLRRELCKMLLEPAGTVKVIGRLRRLARGRRARSINDRIRYLRRHLPTAQRHGHLHYNELRKQHVPIGSGVVESAIRRVINLRFKSASMCWKTEHLYPLLCLRAVLKARRWDDLMNTYLARTYYLPATTCETSETTKKWPKAA